MEDINLARVWDFAMRLQGRIALCAEWKLSSLARHTHYAMNNYRRNKLFEMPVSLISTRSPLQIECPIRSTPNRATRASLAEHRLSLHFWTGLRDHKLDDIIVTASRYGQIGWADGLAQVMLFTQWRSRLRCGDRGEDRLHILIEVTRRSSSYSAPFGISRTTSYVKQQRSSYMRRVQWKGRLRRCTFEYLSPWSTKGNVVKVKRDRSITRCIGDCHQGRGMHA